MTERGLAAHQVAAVRRLLVILEHHRGALLADGPGLGKTWTAAAVAARRAARGDEVEVVAPANLRAYWRETMARFGVGARVVSHDLLARERMQRDVCLRPRLIVVDEAHRFRNPRTKRYEGLARMTIGARVLLVTATPVSNAASDLASVLALVAADDELAEAGVPSIADCVAGVSSALEAVTRRLIVRREAGDVAGLVPEVFRQRIVYRPVPNAAQLRERIARLTYPWMCGSVSRDLVRMLLDRRLESSVAALAATLRRMMRLCLRARSLAERGVSLSAADLRAVLGDPDAGSFQDLLFPALWGAAGSPTTVAELDAEIVRLDDVAACLPDDPKPALLEEIVRSRAGTAGLVFTASYDTARSLFDRMSGLTRCALLTGKRCVVRAARRDVGAVVAALASGAVDLVVATDVGGEGLNLEAAGWVVHYDQPWSPALLEQRNGRIGRMGQSRHEVESIELVPRTSRVRPILERKSALLERLRSRLMAGETATTLDSGAGWRLPGAVDSRDPEAQVARLLRGRGLYDGEIAELLSTRQRAGAERWLAGFLETLQGRREVEQLRMILLAERALTGSDARAI